MLNKRFVGFPNDGMEWHFLEKASLIREETFRRFGRAMKHV